MEKVFAFLGISSEASQTALVGGLVAVFGAGITALVTIWIAARTWKENARLERDRRDTEVAVEQKRRDADRDERKGDLRRAIRADVFNIWQALYLYGSLEQRIEAVRQKFAEAKKNKELYTPFVTSSIGTVFGDKVTDDLLLLDENDIQPVVAFYRQIKVIEGFSGDLRAEGFALLGLDRKEKMLCHFLTMEDGLRRLAEQCLSELDQKIAIPKDQSLGMRKAVLDQQLVNNTGTAQIHRDGELDLSDPSQGRLP